ncbi:hypothetical protein PVAND_003853 [Polypedilum vanderplanki]|uniref:PDZ domain-containing protein n=1 Tax=Polypedilum vanderplanki TaxID=319348 RepID=A0A9J6BVA1_POLVA|nr:hypothetical protein PVAND_003853 [Polypedilum vanderplanki]
MRTGVSNNNKIYADKFENIDNLSNNNNNNSPSIDLLNYSNNNVYADIVDLDDTVSLMYSQNAQQFDRGRHDRSLSSSRKANDEQSFYLANSSVTSRSFDKSYHSHSIDHQNHRRHYSSSELNYPQPSRPLSQNSNSYYNRASSHPIKDYSNSVSVRSPLAIHSTNNIQAVKGLNSQLNNSVSAPSSSAYNSSKMNSNSKMATDIQKHMPSNSSSARSNKQNVNSIQNKRKIISPEEVIQLFSVPANHGNVQHPQHPHLTGFLGHHHQTTSRQRTSSGSAIINESHRGRKSPSSASSPPTMTHQLYRDRERDRAMMMRDQHMSHSIPNINQLATRTIHLKRSDSTKAQNLSLPLKQSTQHGHKSSSSVSSTTHNKNDLNSKDDINHSNNNNNGFGLCVKGNKVTGRGVIISKVEIGSAAYLAGLRAGDAILEINGTPFTSLHHEEAVKKCTQILKAEKFCSMTIRSPESSSNATIRYNSFDESQLHQYPRDDELYIPVLHDSGSVHSAPLKVGCIWIDRHGRSVSPPHEYSHRSVEKMDRIKRIDLLIEPGQSLGLMIRGGIEYGLGIFVTGVDKDSVAERAGLMIGDQILEVNNRSFLEITHDEAVNLLKCHKRMTILIRDIGKIPFAATPQATRGDLSLIANEKGSINPLSYSYNNNSINIPSNSNNYPQSSSSWHGDGDTSRHISTSSRFIKKNCSISSIEEKARSLLSRNHLLNLIHNISEYGSRRTMDIETFVLILLELLDTPEKHSLVSEIRDIVYPEDRLRFDELMFQHGVTVNVLGNNVATLYGRSGGVFKNRLGLKGINDQLNHSGLHSGSYFDGIRSITQRLQSWYFGRPLSRQQLTDGAHLTHQDHERSRRTAREHEMRSSNIIQNSDGNLLVSVPKTKAILGLAIEGGSNTKHPLPRIINIHENGAAFEAGGLEVGQLILEVDNQKVEGKQHQDIARLIAESYTKSDRPYVTFLVSEPKKSNLEAKSAALYLETLVVIIHFCLNVIFLIL